MSGGAVAAAAARARAMKASGGLVRVEPAEFERLLNRNLEALVVHAPGGFLRGGHRYLTSYKGLTFHTRSKELLTLPSTCEVVEAKRIWSPM